MNQIAARPLGLWSLTALVTGNLIGSGIFLLPSALAPYGFFSLVGWTLCAIGALCLAGVFSYLSVKFPHINGPIGYIQHRFGPFLGTLAAWSYWFMTFISNGALVIAGVSYLQEGIWGGALHSTPSPGVILGMQVGVIILMAFINSRGLKIAGIVEVVLTGIKLLPLALVPLLALVHQWKCGWSTLPGPMPSLGSSAGIVGIVAFKTLWGFMGLETGTVPAGHVDQPAKNIPLATLLGTFVAACVGIGGMWAILSIVPLEVLQHSSAPYAETIGYVLGGQWHRCMAIVMGLACIGSLNGWFIVTTQLLITGAKEGVFPRFFAASEQDKPPLKTILVSCGGLIPILVLTFDPKIVVQFEKIIDLSVSVVLCIYGLSCAVLGSVLWKERHQGILWLTVVGGSIFTFFAFTCAGLGHFLSALGFFLLGLPWYLWRYKATR